MYVTHAKNLDIGAMQSKFWKLNLAQVRHSAVSMLASLFHNQCSPEFPWT